MSTPTRRRGAPDTTYDWPRPDGSIVTLVAGADGIVTVTDADEMALADSFGLEVVADEPTTSGKRTRKAGEQEVDTTTDESAGEPAQEA